jgi:hypothetical protein
LAARDGAITTTRPRIDAATITPAARAAADRPLATLGALLAETVPSTFWPDVFASERDWQTAVARSSVRLQRDPDYGPTGAPIDRRAIQLGMRGVALRRLDEEWTVDVEDVSALGAEQRELRREHLRLMTPRESVYVVGDSAVVARLRVTPFRVVA